MFGVHFWTLLLEPGFGVQELHFSTLSRLAFWAQHPPGNPRKRGNGGSDLPGKEAGIRGPMADGFFCGLVVDATTRSDTTCSRRWGQTTDLSARLADSVRDFNRGP